MLSYLFGISRRWEMIFFLFSGITVVYTLRVNMSVAAPKMRDELNWSEKDKGYVLSSFYWGYAIGQIPAVLFAQTYGGKWLFGFSVLLTSILTLFVPVAANSSLGWTYCLRGLIGFFESASFPAIFYFFPYWVPQKEKTIMVPITLCGVYMGEVIGFSLSGYLVESVVFMNKINYGGWPSVFYVFGLAGIAWFPLWAWFAYDKPDLHPYISKEELEHIHNDTNYATIHDSLDKSYHSVDIVTGHPMNVVNTETSHHRIPSMDIIKDSSYQTNDKLPLQKSMVTVTSVNETSKTPLLAPPKSFNHHTNYNDIPWKPMFTNKSSLTNFVCSWVFGYIGFMLLSEMPSYLTEQLHFDLTSAGLLCIAPYASMLLVTLGFGALFDYLQSNYNWKNRRVRQWAQFIAFGGSGGMLLICGFVDNKYAAYLLMVIGQAVLGVSQVGLACVYLEIAPRYSSIMNTIGNTIGAIAGIVGPIIVAVFVDTWEGIWGWRAVFIMTAAMCAVALILWAKYQTSDVITELNTPISEQVDSENHNYSYRKVSDEKV